MSAAERLQEPAQRRPKPLRHNEHVIAIVKVVADRFGVPSGDVLSDCRTPTVVRARDIAVHVAMARYRYSQSEIGGFLGKTRHGIIDSCRRARKLLEEFPAIREFASELITRKEIGTP